MNERSLSASHGITFVGIGPGDPSLMTLAAVKAINNATIVAFPVSREGGIGMAEEIASELITTDKQRLPLFFPMVSAVEPRKQAWKEAADQLIKAVLDGEQVVFISVGDVSLFSSSSYILLYIKAHFPQCPVRLVPGVTSISAAAAIGEWPLSIQDDQLLVLPTPDNPKTLENLLEDSMSARRVIALLKLGHRWSWVRPLLEKRDLLQGSLFAQRVGWSDQEVVQASCVDENIKPYFSLLLIRQSWPSVVP